MSPAQGSALRQQRRLRRGVPDELQCSILVPLPCVITNRGRPSASSTSHRYHDSLLEQAAEEAGNP
jgi:hypothetical protein